MTYSIPRSVTQFDIDESNDAFADVVGRFATKEPRLLHAAVKHEYGALAEENPVARYNLTRCYWINEVAAPRSTFWPSYGKPIPQSNYGLWPEDDGYLHLENETGLVPIPR